MSTVTHLAAEGDTQNLGAYVPRAAGADATITPGTGVLIIVTAVVSGSTIAGGGAFTCSDNRGGTYTRVATALSGTSANQHAVFIRTANTTSALSHTITVSVSGDNGTGAVVNVKTVTGMTRFGSAAIRSVSGTPNIQTRDNQTAGTAPTFTLPNAPLTGNPLISWLGCATNPTAMTQPGSFTKDVDTGYATPTQGFISAHRDSGQTTTGVAWSNPAPSQWGGGAFELDTSNPGVAVGQATESDTAQPIGRVKQATLGEPSETDTAQTIGRVKNRAAGQATETDLAQAVGRVKQRAVGQPAETDLAQPIARVKRKTLGQATETDLSQPVTLGANNVIGQALETDIAQPVGRVKRKTLGQAVETDTAQPVGRTKTGQLGIAAETDLAQTVARTKARTLGQALEADLAQAIGRLKTLLLGQATETDEALSISNIPPPLIKIRVSVPPSATVRPAAAEESSVTAGDGRGATIRT